MDPSVILAYSGLRSGCWPGNCMSLCPKIRARFQSTARPRQCRPPFCGIRTHLSIRGTSRAGLERGPLIQCYQILGSGPGRRAVSPAESSEGRKAWNSPIRIWIEGCRPGTGAPSTCVTPFRSNWRRPRPVPGLTALRWILTPLQASCPVPTEERPRPKTGRH